MKDRSARAAKLGVLVALIGLVIWAVLRSQRAAPLPSPPPLASENAPSPGRETTRERASPLSAGPPIIDSITVEKDEVCEGEENLVTVHAHTPDESDAFLHYQIGPTSGSPVALRSYLDDRDHPSAHRVSVFGKNNVVTTVLVPPYRVKPCDAGPAVVIEHRLRPNTMADFDFNVRIVNASARADGGEDTSFRPREFAWSFGDGSREDAREPHATHSFAERPQNTLYSEFLVTVAIRGEDGRTIEGRHALELLNPAFEAFAYKGIVIVFSDLDPRFPALSADGVVDQGVRLWHARPEPVTITKVTTITRYIDSGAPSTAATPDVRSVLGTDIIGPGPGLVLHVKLDTRAEPRTFARDYALEGRATDGHVVRGHFSVMRPPALPTKEQHDPITDPVLLAKVKMAREVLHREFVTDEDLWSLERAGQFKGLRVDREAPASSVAKPPSLRPSSR